MSSSVPCGWVNTTLGEIIEKITGGGTPARTNENFWNGSIPWATVKDLTAKKLSKTQETITHDGLLASAANIIPKKTPIIATRMAVGKCVSFSCDVAINQDLKALFTGSKVENEFLLHWMEAKQARLESISSGSTVKGVRLEDIEGLEICLPPLAEQQKIAEILTTVDEVIENTEAEISKLEDLKKATMNELLTKGIGHTEFKETEIGRIPKSWEVKALQEIVEDRGIQTGPFGSQLHAAEYVGSGVPVVMPTDIDGGRINIDSAAKITNEKSIELSRHSLRVGDVIFSRRGDVGRTAVVDARSAGSVCGTGCLRARLNKRLSDADYIACYLLKDHAQQWLKLHAVGQTMPNLNTQIVGALPIVLPPFDEQVQIAAVIHVIGYEAELRRTKVRSFASLRRALMQDLLTGKVRVKVN
jgi:type I restriction enzyme S subunit